MTTISLKLVSNDIDKLININKDSITMLDIFSYLMENGMLMTEISQIMFINNGKNITNDVLTLFNGTDKHPLIIHMFTNKLEIKNEIIKHIFMNDAPPYEVINSHEEEINTIVSKNNIKTIELFADKDFVYLLNICHNKPELINTVSSYLTNGTITNFEIKDINNFNYENEFIKLVELLNSINKQFDENELKSIIQHFEGNLNLSLRYILNK
jgi:hypothetical protein